MTARIKFKDPNHLNRCEVEELAISMGVTSAEIAAAENSDDPLPRVIFSEGKPQPFEVHHRGDIEDWARRQLARRTGKP